MNENEEGVPAVRPKDLRDEFAMAALTGMYAAGYGTADCTVSEIAHDAYRLSDAMMEARDAGK